MQYKFTFYELGIASFEKCYSENTPELRKVFIDELLGNIVAKIQVASLELKNADNEKDTANCTREHKLALAQKYFVDKHESMFVKYGWVNMQPLSTYNLKVNEI